MKYSSSNLPYWLVTRCSFYFIYIYIERKGTKVSLTSRFFCRVQNMCEFVLTSENSSNREYSENHHFALLQSKYPPNSKMTKGNRLKVIEIIYFTE